VVHCDVGGGYLEHELSDVALLWMVGAGAPAAVCASIPTHSAAVAVPGIRPHPMSMPHCTRAPVSHPDPLGDQHNSRNGFLPLVFPPL